MYQNFILLHRELTAVSSVEPRFLASFGTGHVNPENEKGIARLLQADKASPVKSSVSVIGVQYINCYFGKENSFKASEGMLTMICKKKATEVLDAVKLSEKRSLKWISATALSEVGCGSRATELAGMSLIAGFAATSPYFWQ